MIQRIMRLRSGRASIKRPLRRVQKGVAALAEATGFLIILLIGIAVSSMPAYAGNPAKIPKTINTQPLTMTGVRSSGGTSGTQVQNAPAGESQGKTIDTQPLTMTGVRNKKN